MACGSWCMGTNLRLVSADVVKLSKRLWGKDAQMKSAVRHVHESVKHFKKSCSHLYLLSLNTGV